MASSSKDAQNENEGQNESETALSERQENTNHSRSNSAVSPPAWRVVFLSSKVRHTAVLNSAARSSVLFVPYKYDNSTLESLLLQAQQTLAGRKAESIAFLAHGQGSNMVICANDDQVCFSQFTGYLLVILKLNLILAFLNLFKTTFGISSHWQ